MSFDVKCMELAMQFLPADAEQIAVDDLAQQIQDTIESYCDAHEAMRNKELEDLLNAENQKDQDEYIEEMSLGGRKYEPGQSS